MIRKSLLVFLLPVLFLIGSANPAFSDILP
jgi:hypothetical protein